MCTLLIIIGRRRRFHFSGFTLKLTATDEKKKKEKKMTKGQDLNGNV